MVDFKNLSSASLDRLEALRTIGDNKDIFKSANINDGSNLSIFQGNIDNFKKIDLGLNEAQMSTLFKAIDVNGDGEIDEEEMNALAALGGDDKKGELDIADIEAICSFSQDNIDAITSDISKLFEEDTTTTTNNATTTTKENPAAKDAENKHYSTVKDGTITVNNPDGTRTEISKDKDGNMTTTVYDKDNKQISKSTVSDVPKSRADRQDYANKHGAFSVTEKDDKGRDVTIVYNADGTYSKITEREDGTIMTSSYNEKGQNIEKVVTDKETGEVKKTITFDRNENDNGYTSHVKYANGGTKEAHFGDDGKFIDSTYTSADGKTEIKTTRTYNSDNSYKDTSVKGDTTTTKFYDKDGNLEVTTIDGKDNNGNTISDTKYTEPEAFGLEYGNTEMNAYSTHIEYKGNGDSTITLYDKDGKKIGIQETVKNDDGTSVTTLKDAEGNIIGSTKESSVETSSGYIQTNKYYDAKGEYTGNYSVINYNDDGSIKEEYHEKDSNITIVETDKDGNKTITKKDKHGNIITE